jgi:hypothetical protein
MSLLLLIGDKARRSPALALQLLDRLVGEDVWVEDARVPGLPGRVHLAAVAQELRQQHLARGARRGHVDMSPQELTPLHRLRLPLPAGRRPVALVFNGTFCPIHNNHVRLLEAARQHLEDVLGWYVVGGYLMITHDDSCRGKLGSGCASWRSGRATG